MDSLIDKLINRVSINRELLKIKTDLYRWVIAKKQLYKKNNGVIEFSDMRKIENSLLQIECDLFEFADKYENEINNNTILEKSVSNLFYKLNEERVLCQPVTDARCQWSDGD